MSSNSPWGSNSGSNSNPYASAPMSYGAAKTTSDFPVFTTVSMVICIILGALRLLITLVGVVGLFALVGAQSPLAILAAFEILVGFALGFSTVGSGVLMLMKQRLGITVAKVQIASFVSAMVIGIVGAIVGAGNNPVLQNPNNQNAMAVMIGMIVGMGVVLAIRIGFEVLFVAGYIQFQKWADKNGI